MWAKIFIFIALSMLASSALAEEEFTQQTLRRLLRNKVESIQDLAANEVVLQAVRRQNERALSLAQIKKIDKEWASSKEFTPLKRSLQENAVGEYFKNMIDFNEHIYSEAFLTDRRGANVAAYPVTTDYWQGDEKKWIEAFNNGSGKIYLGSIVFDESTQATAIQISVPVMDDGRAIGVLTVGVKLTYVQAKYLNGD